MCRTSGAWHRYTPRTQRSRAGLTSDAPTALQEKRRCRPKGRRYKGGERNRPLRQEPERERARKVGHHKARGKMTRLRRYRKSEDVGLKADATKAEKGTDLSDRSRSAKGRGRSATTRREERWRAYGAGIDTRAEAAYLSPPMRSRTELP